ncbi:hypothetical protein F511_03790 [Dorcoceras hygrometricum]|uniref:Aminotransferase class I/classII large domain-containing protein n=1 Tax=Dorcoceras hygrometricum TaxID=472368 RepID=A0A2Z7BPG0_9LAMI|nr:hypothetical protein F511_03790 [Dorcoceras hygrometricum]
MKKQSLHGGDETESPQTITIKGILGLLMESIDCDDKQVISLGIGDPTVHSCFRTTVEAQEAAVDALRSAKFNGYSPTAGLPQTREAIANYLSSDLPYELSADDVYVTAGCTQAIEVVLSVLARPGCNILLPRPGFPIYELSAAFRNIEVRYFDLLPGDDWEVDLHAVEDLADNNTTAMVIINPGNPCGNVYTSQHLEKIAMTAKLLGIVVIADEVYGHLAFGANPFVPMGMFGSVAPVITLGSLSKRWLVPGWRLGWLVTTTPNGTFKNAKVFQNYVYYLSLVLDVHGFDPQGAVPGIIEGTRDVFFEKNIRLLTQTSDICYKKMKAINCFSCPSKPQGSMTFMVKLNISLLKDISDDLNFCFKLAKEESVIILPGVAVGLKNWLRITFAAEPSALEEALERVKSFSERHAC